MSVFWVVPHFIKEGEGTSKIGKVKARKACKKMNACKACKQ